MVSVLLPVRDAESTISACVRSMQRQRLESFECVLVDDGSTDRSVAVYRAAAGDDPRFRIVGGTGEGIVPALNLGLEHCRGTFVARMDGDDVMHRDRLAAQHVAAERSDRPLLLGCHTRLFPRDDNLGSGIRQYEKWLNSLLDGTDVQRDRFVECPLPHPTWFVRRSRMMEIGYQDVDWPEDYDFLLRHLAAGGEIGTVPRRLLAWRHGPTRLSQRSPRYGPKAFTRCKAHHLARGYLRDHPTFDLWGYGATGRSLCRELAGHGRQPRWIVETHPGRVGQTIAGARVVSPGEVDATQLERLLVSVAGAEPREQIRRWLTDHGHVEGQTFICLA